MKREAFKKELTKFNAWKWQHSFNENLDDYEVDAEHYINEALKQGQELPIFNVNQQRELLLAFAKWQYEDNDFNKANEMMVDTFLKVNNSTPQQMAERIKELERLEDELKMKLGDIAKESIQAQQKVKELTIMNTNLIELNDKKDVEVRESQQEVEMKNDFISWYSGMSQDKINKAYLRFLKETKQNKEG